MVDYYPSVDTDLFVNMFSKGLNDARQNPSGLNSFLGGLLEGLDAHQKYEINEQNIETAEQQSVIRQNQIDQLPVENALKQAELDKKNAELQFARNNPEKFAELQQREMENKILQEQQETQLREKQIKFNAILSDPKTPSKQKMDAILSGEFTEAMTAEMIQKIEHTVIPSLEVVDAERWFTADRIKKQIEYNAKRTETAALAQEKARAEFEKDTGIGTLAATISVKTGKEVSRFDLLHDGEIIEEWVPKSKAMPEKEDVIRDGKPVLGPDGKVLQQDKVVDGVIQYIGGNEHPTMFPDPDKVGEGDYKKIFKYTERLPDGTTKIHKVEQPVSSDLEKSFNGFQELKNVEWRKESGMGGTPDQRAALARVQKEKETREAVARSQEAATDEEVQARRATFESGRNINPAYIEAQRREQEVWNQNKREAEARAAAKETPEATSTPEMTATREATATSRTKVEANLPEESRTPTATRTPDKTATTTPTTTPTETLSRGAELLRAGEIEALTEKAEDVIPKPWLDDENSLAAQMNPSIRERIQRENKEKLAEYEAKKARFREIQMLEQRKRGLPIPTPVNPLTISVPTGVATQMATQTPTQTSTQAPSNTPTPTATPASQSTWEKDQTVKRQMAKNKSSTFLEKHKPTPVDTPVESKPPPQQQMTKVTAPPIPQHIVVKNAVAQPNYEAVKQVASLPEVRYSSALTKAFLVQESAGVNSARSPKGVLGLAQVTEETANEISPELNRANSIDSVISGAVYLEKLLATPQFKGNEMLALTSYNTGAGVVGEAINLAGGSTDWNTVKKYISAAVFSPRFDKYWREKKGFSTEDIANKAREASTYAEKVIVNLPLFIQSSNDMRIAHNLKRQGILDF